MMDDDDDDDDETRDDERRRETRKGTLTLLVGPSIDRSVARARETTEHALF